MTERERQYNRAEELRLGEPEPRWLAFVALLADGGLYAALPAHLAILPRWLLLGIIVVLLVPTVLTNRRGHHALNQVFGYLVNGVITSALVGSLALLVRALPTHRVMPAELLVSATALWLTNILVFALWYWRLDAGGPNYRDRRAGHAEGAFLFPQMTREGTKAASGQPLWSPNFIDYLFLAFNTSTALSPTDVPVLSRWAKLLMMLQALISLTVLVLLAARAVNIL